MNRSMLRPLILVLLGASCGRPPPRTSLDAEPPRLVNAFFGLDDALPTNANLLCRQAAAAGKDGMPVTFSRRLSGQPNPSAFAVTTRSGAVKTPFCATTAPANERPENHTVLLVGDLGGVDDPPVLVTVTGDVAIEGDANARGASVAVTPLEDGPTLVLALGVRAADLETDCPASTKQVVIAIWAGGVTPVDGTTQETHRLAYRVTTGAEAVIPFALGNLNDQDNYVHLCLDTDVEATRVSAAAGVLVDPRRDVNPETSVTVSR